MHNRYILTTLALTSCVWLAESFSIYNMHNKKFLSSIQRTYYSSPSDEADTTSSTAVDDSDLIRLEDIKEELIDICEREDLTSSSINFDISRLVCDLEEISKEVDVGQNSSTSGLLSGKWKLIYASEDLTRSSPFFWGFRKAFSESADQIFSITDSIPSPVKEVGPATQEITIDEDNKAGKLISRVKVATLGGVATSMMTTRSTIISTDESSDTIRVRIDSTKPEDSTVLKNLGPLGNYINENAPPFPSGEALEKYKQGSSEVLMQNTYVDDNLRISRDKEGLDDFFVWIRDGFLGDFDV